MYVSVCCTDGAAIVFFLVFHVFMHAFVMYWSKITVQVKPGGASVFFFKVIYAT